MHGQGLSLLPFGGEGGGGGMCGEATVMLRVEHTELSGELVNITGPAPESLIPETFPSSGCRCSAGCPMEGPSAGRSREA